eukprot:4522394-Pyramimonas_sp.AAC.1
MALFVPLLQGAPRRNGGIRLGVLARAHRAKLLAPRPTYHDGRVPRWACSRRGQPITLGPV